MWWSYPIAFTTHIIMIIFSRSVLISLDAISYKYFSNRSIILTEHFIFFVQMVLPLLCIWISVVFLFLLLLLLLLMPILYTTNQHSLLKNQKFIVLCEIIFCGYHIHKHPTPTQEKVRQTGGLWYVCVGERKQKGGSNTSSNNGWFVCLITFDILFFLWPCMQWINCYSLVGWITCIHISISIYIIYLLHSVKWCESRVDLRLRDIILHGK